MAHHAWEARKQVPIAITGVAFEFPQEATSEESFWQMICQGRSASTEFPRDRLNIDAFYHPDGNRPSSIPLRGGHFVKEDLGVFDAPFFTITPEDAACMDPQHRRTLETAYLALEDAGIPIDRCSGSDTSVYTGCFTGDYMSILQQDYEAEQRHAAMGAAVSMLANRLSWFFNFKGASVNLDSACSSSLVALHLACQDLQSGASSMALVGGANLVFHPNFMKFMTDFNFLSPDSRCWSFDQRANGYARGEGTAVLVLKRLDDALRDGDTIRAVIRSTGLNQDGRTPGITQPDQDAQVNLIRRTYEQADLSMEPTRFFESHGTGTSVGDPIEAKAIATAFAQCRTTEDPLYIGAVKANIGHLEGCSGLAGLIKTILVLENGVIPPIAGFQVLNSKIDTQGLHLQFPVAPLPWPAPGLRRACVNSFGFGGTNATVVLDDAYHYLERHGLRGHHRTRETTGALCARSATPNMPRNDKPMEGQTRPRLLVWSAADQAGVRRLTEAYRHYIPQQTSQLDDLAYYLALRRTQFTWRCFGVVDPTCSSDSPSNSSTEEPVVFGGPVEARRASSAVQIAFVFTGQGAQYAGMGRQLVHFPAFKASLQRSDEYLRQSGCQWSVLDAIHGSSAGGKPDLLDINLPEYSQPLTTCLQIALVDLLRSFGITPSALLGHSSGEIAAAYAAGALSHASAVRAASSRGALSKALADQPDVTGLSMMAVGLSRQHVDPFLDQLRGELLGELNVSVGCINSPKSVTLTGRTTELTILASWFRKDNIFARMLRVPLAYHSRFMSAIADSYSAAIGSLNDEGRDGSGQRESRQSLVPMVSSVTGDLVEPQSLRSAAYWARNLTSPVEFEKAFARLMALNEQQQESDTTQDQQVKITHVLEIGPHSALATYVRENLKAIPAGAGGRRPAYVPTLVRNRNSSSTLLQAVGALHCAGYPVDLLAANSLSEARSPRPSPPTTPPPRYPFNHTRSYWAESRLSKNFRFRETARHDLLGSRALDWNPQVAQWRNVIRLAEVPWLQDHTINGEVIFPAAAMLVIAIEALRELLGGQTQGSSGLLGIEIQDASFIHPITFARGTETAEIQFNLSTTPQPGGYDRSTSSQFRLFVIENGSYIECCSGSIRPILKQYDQDKAVSYGPWGRGKQLPDWLQDVSTACRGRSYIDPYAASPPGSTLRYGPCFQNVQEMCLGARGFATAKIDTEAWRSKPPGGRPPAYAIHPATLDGLAQLVTPVLSQNGRHLPTMVPVRLARLWLDLSSGASLCQGRMRVAAKCRLRGYRGASADIVGTCEGGDTSVVYMNGLETNFISSTTDASIQLPPRKLCTRLVWKPDVGLMSPEQMCHYCVRERPAQPPGAVQEYQSLVTAIFCFVLDAIKFVKERPDLILAPHLEAYVGWMEFQEQRLLNGECPVTHASVQAMRGDLDAQELLLRQLEDSGPYSCLFIKVGRSLTGVLSGEVDPLGLIYDEDRLAEGFYDEALGNEHHAYPAAQYLDLLSFKKPSMNILEIGAGTGGQTVPLLRQLSSDGIRKWARYDYTDISPEFLERARTKFRGYATRSNSSSEMNFRLCDISRDPVSEQSFEAGTYDLIIASHVLHATPNLDQSLRNVRKLLKPDGKLLLFETTQPETIHTGFAFGLLSGWWAPLQTGGWERRSPHSPCLTVAQWDQELKSAGFCGVEVEIPGQQEPLCRFSSIMVASVASHLDGDAMPTGSPREVALVINERVEAQRSIATLLERQIEDDLGLCKTWDIVSLSTACLPESTLVVFMVELEGFFLEGISRADFERLQSVLLRYKRFLWVIRAAHPGDPRLHLVDGLGRCLMSEDSTWGLATLSLDALAQDHAVFADTITRVVPIVARSAVEDLETNWVATQEGPIQTSRVSEDAAMDETVARGKQPRRQEEVARGDGIQCSLQIGLPGSHDTVQWTESEPEDDGTGDLGLPGDDEIILDVRAFGLTRRDYLVATGHLDEMKIGTDCAGVVLAAGKTSSFQVGDKVMALAQGTAHSSVRIREGAAVPMPPNMSFTEASSLPTAVWLAYEAVCNVARVREGECVLVLGGASCVGQMAIQLGRGLGAQVMTTVSSADKGVFVRDQLGVAQTAIFHESDSLSLAEMHRHVSGSGIDAIVGSLTGEAHQYTSLLAAGGRIVDIGLENMAPVMPDKSLPVNTSRTSVDMTGYLREQPTRALQTFQRAMELANRWRLKLPQTIHIFGAGQVGAALRHLSDRDGIGRRIINLDTDDPIVASVRTRPRYTFPADATYIIAGGLGGLGRSIGRWMVGRGARHLILLSRSGAKGAGTKALEFIRELEAQGVSIAAPATNIGDLALLTRELGRLASLMPPIRGCIQAAVAFRDVLFQNMTFDDWSTSIRAKITGSWNLHLAVPTEHLDFFVLISSLNGILGGRGQANYTAGNTFQDALAHYRVARGQTAVSIDLGLMVDEGVIAENKDLLVSLQRLGLLMNLGQEDLHSLLDHYCDPGRGGQLGPGDEAKAQMLVGIERPAAIVARGLDVHHALRRPMFRHLFRMGVEAGEGAGDEVGGHTTVAVDRPALLRAAGTTSEAALLVGEWFEAKMTHTLGLAEGSIDRARPPHTYGIDSLVAIDLKNWFAREIGAEVAVFALLGNSSLDQLAIEATNKSRYRKQDISSLEH